MDGATIAVEGITDEAIAHRLLAHTGHTAGAVHVTGGKADLDRRLPGYNRAARHWSWFVLRDLDHDADCAPTLVSSVLAAPAEQMCFRIAVRAVEAWLLGDADSIARYLHVSSALVPVEPERLAKPKEALVDLARRSRSRVVRADLVPAAGSTAQVGPAYTSGIVEFVGRHWRPEAAAARCPSLRGCLDRLRSWDLSLPRVSDGSPTPTE